jgi:hypothetical protein
MQEPERTTIQKDVLRLFSEHNNSIRITLKNYTDAIDGGGVLSVRNKPIDCGVVIAFCTAGVGNRIMTLIGATYWANKLNCTLKICWDESTCCMCPYEQLFKNSYNLLISRETFCQILLDNINEKSIIGTNCSDKINLLTLQNSSLIIYNDSTLPYYISHKEANLILNAYKIKDEIIKKVNYFIEKFSVNSSTVGLHIRKIDPPEQRTNRKSLPLSFYKKIINNDKNQKFFICSDSEEIENELKKFKNTCCYDKSKYPAYNNFKDITYRDMGSVIEGVIDMLILSHTKIHPLCLQLSSFCKASKYFSQHD